MITSEQVESTQLLCSGGVVPHGGDFPTAIIRVNIHYITYDEGGIMQNFHPGPFDDGSNWENGNYYGQKLIEFSNNNRLANLTANPINQNSSVGVDFIGDSNMRFELYADPNNTDDIHGGIWYWDNQPASFPYQGEVINIIAQKITSPIGGQAFPSLGNVILFGWHEMSKSYPGGPENRYTDMARILLHEVGHVAGLCHVYTCDNPCSDVDKAAECNASVSCEANNCSGKPVQCNPSSAGSQNIMGNFNEARSLSPCQWFEYYGYFAFGHGQRYAQQLLGSGCDEPLAPAIIIATGQQQLWDSPKVLNGDVIIEANASLTINCLVLAAPDVSIIVKRGGKLTVEYGEIRRLCPDKAWKGINVEGHRSKEQPDLNLADPTANYTDPDIAGAVVLLNATLRGSRTGVHDGKVPEWWLRDYYGGLVIAEGSTSVDNRRGAAFYLYPLPNKSYFTNCTFTIVNEDAIVGSTEGVTIWGSHGIGFKQCRFLNMSSRAIHGEDYGVNISSGNTFTGNRFAVSVLNTFPLSSLGPINIGPASISSTWNYFDSNLILNDHSSGDIYAEAVNPLYGMVIRFNNFNNSYRPIRINGSANYEIRFNTFAKSKFGISLNNTSLVSDFECNSLYDFEFGNIIAIGDNTGLSLRYNSFTHPKYLRPISVRRTSNFLPGAIRSAQGAPGFPANNCFEDGSQAIETIAPINAFTYFARNAPFPNQPNCELVPNSGSGYQVTVVNDLDLSNCSTLLPTSPPEVPTRPLLATKRQQESNALALHLSQPSNLQYIAAYEAAKAEKEEVLLGLVRLLAEQEDWAEADQVLAEEGDRRSQRWRIGLKLRHEDWAGAQQLLSQYPQQDADGAYFAEIITVNIERLQAMNAGNLYALPAAREMALYEIAYSGSPFNAYARGLLSLLKGAEFEADPLEEGSEGGGPEQQAIEVPSTPSYALSPNPASGEVLFSFPYSEIPRELHIIGLYDGRRYGRHTLPANPPFALDGSQLSPGMYIIGVYSGPELLYQSKLAIIR
jgi:hypothetical protein